MLSPLWLMWKVRCGKAGYFAAGLVASEQGRRPGLGRTYFVFKMSLLFLGVKNFKFTSFFFFMVESEK